MRFRTILILCGVILLLVAAGLAWRFSHRVVSASVLRITPVSFEALPHWKDSDPRAALAAFRRSCSVLARHSALALAGGAGYAGTNGEWQGICKVLPSGVANADSARHFFETWFRPASISNGELSEGLFTGYYEPELRASRERKGSFQTPVYGLPRDLVDVDLGMFREKLAGEHITGRVDGHRLVPYEARAEIDAKGLAQAPILVFADDPVKVFFLHIQGSGRVRLDDGSIIRLAYAGKNGRPYTPIGRTLLEKGELDRASISLQSIRDWLSAHPTQAREIMESDESFVFFEETKLGDPALGSAGSEGVPLTPEASIAVDSSLHPLGAPFFVTASVPDGGGSEREMPFDRLMVAQDTGGAIRGPVRADFFWGFGSRAEEIAGHMKARGRMFVLLPKQVAARLGAGRDYPLATP